MTRIALFHSVLGIRQGITAAAETFRGAGHEVLVVDQYGGRSFDDYEEAGRFAADIGFPHALMRSALAAIAEEPGAIVTAGFSNGAGMAEYVAATRGGRAGGVLGSLQFAGALPLPMIGLDGWPANTPVQLHYAADDPMRSDEWITPFLDSVRAAASPCEAFLDYGGGHLFTDPSRPDEYDERSAAEALGRALEFLDRLDHNPG